MKIIGTKGAQYLVEADLIEICLIHGFDSLYDNAWEALLKNAHIEQHYGKPSKPSSLEGLEFNVVALAGKIATLRNAQKNADSAAKTLRDLADALQIAWPSLKFSPEKES